ncbi:MAG: FKBP-type peptidyl-prolyl cis-trans isomerase [Actinomycetota bacterium]|jgi:peptidylprolyl isomerase|nr:FKBP-type peptidyl-prolyl cis-trans isomerase [Actinomycetota bacterium]MDA3012156.1 FKBP-type peptidyl-prolyl cis-trans isomerase [Actinomycetota bacterium]MDA3024912.1 FKBP-type peptidyl-prolyl cis-trans isomerase [Actinomycetota bacterium]
MSFRRSFATLAALTLVLAACGGDDSSSDADASEGDELTLVEDPIMDTDEPDVVLPASTPTELVITDVIVGDGPAASDGDTVFVNYVGVLSADGSRFDGNYGSDPFDVTLGMGMVIKGWDQGLIGMQAGGRRQLDIPADLAYGDREMGAAIPPNSALSFVVDMIAVVPATDAADEPSVDISAADNVSELVITDLIVGDGAVAEAGAKAVLHLVAFRADTAAQITSTWASPQPLSFELSEGGTLPGLVAGIQGMKVGGRRQLQVPFADAWGAEGQSDIGLPAEIDLIVVIDLLATF